MSDLDTEFSFYGLTLKDLVARGATAAGGGRPALPSPPPPPLAAARGWEQARGGAAGGAPIRLRPRPSPRLQARRCTG